MDSSASACLCREARALVVSSARFSSDCSSVLVPAVALCFIWPTWSKCARSVSLLLVRRDLSYVPVVLALYDFVFNINFEA